MLYLFASFFSSLSAITSALTITYPERVISLLSRETDNQTPEEQVENMSRFDRLYILLSFSQIPMIIFLLFIDIARIQYYLIYLAISLIVSLRFKKALLTNSLVLQLLTAVELFIAVDVIRSCISLV